MAKAIFTRDFHYTSRRVNAGWSARALPEPQTFPREFINAAVAAGCAVEVLPKRSLLNRKEMSDAACQTAD